MKKYLFISNSTKPSRQQQMSRERIKLDCVSIPCIETALSLGYEVFKGVNRLNAEELQCDYNIKFYNSSTYRSLFDVKSNYTAYKNLMAVLKCEHIDVIHCNTPIGGLIGRICGKKAKVSKVIYTAHGFHFYKGAPILNRTLFKLAEMWMAHYTDAIITINQEDYLAALRFKLRNKGKIYYVPGVGIDTEEPLNVNVNKESFCSKMCLNSEDIICIAMGDLIKRKNYKSSIKAIAKANNPKIHFLICGDGPELKNLQKLCQKLKVEKQIHFLGFRKDIKELLAISDIFLLTSYQEGLPRSMMEAMSFGLPCIVSGIRGNIDLIEEGAGGFLRKPDDIEGLAKCINKLANNKELRRDMSEINLKVIKKFDVSNIKRIIKEIYLDILR